MCINQHNKHLGHIFTAVNEQLIHHWAKANSAIQQQLVNIDSFHQWHCKKTCTLWGIKLHPFNFINNSVKPHSMLIIFGTQIPE